MACYKILLWSGILFLASSSSLVSSQVTADVPCGTILSEPSGSITYKPFEEASKYERCVWILSVEGAESYTINLYTIGYETGLSPPSNGLITFGLTLGSHTPHIQAPVRIDTDYTINGSVAILTYYTKDERLNLIRGFSLHYVANPAGDQFPVPKNSSNIIVSSTLTNLTHPPDEGRNYSNSELSTFLFTPHFSASNATAFTNEIRFTQLGLERDSCSDFIDVFRFDGGHTSTRWSTFGRICGPDRNVTLSNDDIFLLAFHSDDNNVTGAGFHLELERRPNLPGRDVGETCEANEQCPSNSSCSATDKRCTCNEAFVPSKDNKRCLPIRERLEEDCEESQQCAVNNSTCKVEANACLCQDGFVGSDDKQKCFKVADPDEPCEDSAQCPDNSECESGICRCHPGFVEADGKCLPEMNLGGPCDQSVQCPENSDCTNGVCRCASGFVEFTGKCLPERKLGESCEANEQCPNNAICSNDNVCLCIPPKVPSEDRTTCIDPKDVGDICFDNGQCPGNSTCFDDAGSERCTCNEGFVPSRDNKKCLPVREMLGEECEESVQCPENSDCTSGACRCRPGFVEVDGKCLPE